MKRNTVQCRHPETAFSLIELLVTIALLSFIVVGLLSMFQQTQKAFRRSMKQVDVLEAGRAATDLLGRELSQIAPTYIPWNPTQPWVNNSPNFLAERMASFTQPLYQELPGTNLRRTNIVQRFFFMSRYNTDWIGTGYIVIADYPDAGVGTLYRFSTNRNRYTASSALQDFLNAPLAGMSRVADGIVHFRVRAFATNGFPIEPMAGQGAPVGFRTNALSYNLVQVRNGSGNYEPSVPDQVDCAFFSNAVPAFIELEVGILEPPTLERYRGIGPANAVAQRNYLSNHVANVQVFRQRVPILNLDFSAYQ